MPATITQTRRFEAKAADLFEMYMDSRKHTAATGGDAKLSRAVGGKFSVWDEYAWGTNLLVVADRLVVQAWRAADWDEDAPDSTLVLSFRDEGRKGVVEMVHSGIPDEAKDDLDAGWDDNYWKPWKAYLAK